METEVIENFRHMLIFLEKEKSEGRWDSVKQSVGDWLRYITNLEPGAVLDSSEVQLMSKILITWPTSLVPLMKLMMIRLLKEAGDFANMTYPPDGGYCWYRRALDFLLVPIGNIEELSDYRDLLPTLDSLVEAIGKSPMPRNTRILVMREYARRNQFKKVLDQFLAARRTNGDAPRLIAFTLEVFEGISNQSDERLAEGGLTRIELDRFLIELKGKLGDRV